MEAAIFGVLVMILLLMVGATTIVVMALHTITHNQSKVYDSIAETNRHLRSIRESQMSRDA